MPTTRKWTGSCSNNLFRGVMLRVGHHCLHGRYPSLNSSLVIVTLLFVYFFFFRYDNSFAFYHFQSNYFSLLAYSDVFIISGSFLLLSYKTYKKVLKKEKSELLLIEDTPSLDGYSDLYNYSGYAKIVKESIINTSTEKSFGIAIVGEWGSGKSDFMLRLKHELKLSDELSENHIIDFNPWLISKSDAIIDEFFRSLSSELRQYNQNVSIKIREYSSRVLQNSKDVKHRFADSIINEFLPEDSIKQKYDSINSIIKSTGKRFIVFIDDMDRLTGKEVMEVLRLVRNTASFANTFFVVGIDHNYVISVLKNTKDFTNEREYLNKVFQLVISLPSFKKEIFKKEIERIFRERNYSDRRLEIIGSSIQKTEIHIEGLLKNMRDLKRFCNSLIVMFNKLSIEVDLADLIVLELIKNKSTYVYNGLKDQVIIIEDASRQLSLAKDRWDSYKTHLKDTYSYTDIEIEAIQKAIIYLTDEKAAEKNFRRFIYSRNFFIYFSYYLFDAIPVAEFFNVINEDVDTILNKFKYWVSLSQEEYKDKELRVIARGYRDFPNVAVLKNIIVCYLRIDSTNSKSFFAQSDWFNIVEEIVFDERSKNHSKYFNEETNNHKTFLVSIMYDQTIPIQYRAQLAYKFLHEYLYIDGYEDANHLLVMRKNEWQEVLLRLFDEYMETYQKSDISVFLNLMKLYYYNVDHLINRSTHVHYTVLNERFKQQLMHNDRVFKGYLGIFMNKPTFVDRKSFQYQFEGCILEIFGDLNVVIERLQTIRLDDELLQLREIVLEYIVKYSQYGAFSVTADEDAFLRKWWKKIYKELKIPIDRDDE